MANFEPALVLPDRLITAENGDLAASGTTLANYSPILSYALAPASREWGGARNRADRVSDRLTLEQCKKLIAAARFAEAISLPFNRHWIVHSERAGVSPVDGQTFVGRLLRLAGNYVKRRGGKFAAIYSRENGDGKGEHVHILMHIPANLTLLNKTASWVRKAGGRYKAGVSKVRTIGGSLKRLDPTCEHYQTNADMVLAYLLKGANDEAAASLELRRRAEFGSVIGKRCGSTENIGPKAQERRTMR